jgi:hypothetical protein
VERPTTLGIREEYFIVKVMVKLKVIKKYTDIELGKKLLPNEEIEVSRERAEVLLNRGFVKILRVNKLSR